MQITLYNFSKRFNSTKRPTGGTQFEGYLRNSDPTNMFNPTVRFAFNSSTAPAYNYMFIPSFGNRYYWITDWVHIEGVWEATLEVDVLATYKDEIGEKDLYVLRSSAEYDERIIDEIYPAKVTDIETQSLTFNYRLYNNVHNGRDLNNLYNKDFGVGCIVFGLYGPNSAAGSIEGTGVTWWICSTMDFAKLARNLMDFDLRTSNKWDMTTTSQILETMVTELPEDYTKAIADPIQYICGAYWYPFTVNDILGRNPGRVSSFNFGYYKINTDIYAEAITNFRGYNPRITATYAITKHPQAEERGSWLNSDPYTKYHAYIPPFGEFDIPTEYLLNSDNVMATMYVDLATANARMQLHSGTGLRYIGTWTGQFGVPIVVSQLTYDPRGMLQGATDVIEGGINMGTGIFKDLIATLNYKKSSGGSQAFSGLRQSIGGIFNAIEGAQATVKNVGSHGSRLDFQSNVWPVVTSRFKILVDEFNEEEGRPLSKIRKPKNIPGFILAKHGYVFTSGTASEANMIGQFLEGGFFYE